jgi:hypothetical protein
MSKCSFCGGNSKGCICRSRLANDNSPGVIRLPSDERLRAPSSVQRLAIAYGAMGISRRKLIDHIADVIFGDDRIVVDATGRRVLIDDEFADRAFRTDADGSLRWLSEWQNWRHRMPCKGAQERTLPRLRALWLALYIRQPATAMSVIR